MNVNNFWHLKLKMNKIILTNLYFVQFYTTRKLEINGLCVDEESGSGRAKMTGSGSGSATLLLVHYLLDRRTLPCMGEYIVREAATFMNVGCIEKCCGSGPIFNGSADPRIQSWDFGSGSGYN